MLKHGIFRTKNKLIIFKMNKKIKKKEKIFNKLIRKIHDK